MDTKGAKIKGLITSLLSLAFSLDATAFFLFFSFYRIETFGPSLAIAAFFFFEAVGRAYAISYTLANRHLEGEGQEKAKARLAFFMGIAETIYPIAWIAAMVFLSNAANGYAVLLFLLFKISAEIVLSFFRYLPRQKRKITMASENMCSFFVCSSLFLGLFFYFLNSKGVMEKDLADLLTSVVFLLFFLAQNAFFSVLLLQGRAISRIKKMVSFGVEHSIGNYIVVTSCLMTVLVSAITAIRERSFAYAGMGAIYLALGALRLSSLLWKNAIRRNIYNKRLAEASENKILIYAGLVLSALSALFSLGIFWISEQEIKASATFVLVIQIAHGLFRFAICVKNYVSYQKQNQPFSIVMTSLDMLIGAYSLFSLFLLINIYCNFSWLETFTFILTWATFAGTLSLGGIMVWLGFKGSHKEKALKAEIDANSKALQEIIEQHGLRIQCISEEECENLSKDPKFRNCLQEIARLGPSTNWEEVLLQKTR